MLTQIQQEKNSYMQNAYETGQIKLVAGVVDFIVKLSITHTLAVVSNSHEERIYTVLKANNLFRYIKFIVTANEKLLPKPNPAIYLEAIRVMGKTSSECMVIEDSVPGLIAAKQAGLYALAITTGLPEDILKPYSDNVIHSFKQILEVSLNMKQFEQKLKGKVAIISGASSGIGKATAKLLSQEGANIILADTNINDGIAVLDEIRTEGGNGLFVPTDVSNNKDVKNLIHQAIKEFGDIYILFNNAGIDPRAGRID